MELFISFAKGIIEQYGYWGIFILTTLDQFILPIPVDIFTPIGVAGGLEFKKLFLLIAIALFLGAGIGYLLGRWLGHPVAAWLFGKKRLEKSEAFIKKWGFWAIVICAYIPFPFKILAWLAGIFKFPFRKVALGIALGLIPRYFLTAFATDLVIKTKFYASTDMSAVILGALQGLTEFLPISSSGHLVIMEQFLKLPLDVSHLEYFDIILHAGSLLAILIYFWKDWWKLCKEMGTVLKTRQVSPDSMLAKLVLGTVPAIIGGLFFANLIGGPLRGMTAVAFSFIFMALVFLIVEWKKGKAQEETVTLRQAVLIGIAQAIALIPAVSRSGLTIATGMMMGIKRETAARFSFMLGGIGILAANVYTFFSLKGGALIPNLQFVLVGFFTSFVVSLIAIFWLIKFLQKHTLRPFAFYLLLVGVLILSFF